MEGRRNLVLGALAALAFGARLAPWHLAGEALLRDLDPHLHARLAEAVSARGLGALTEADQGDRLLGEAAPPALGVLAAGIHALLKIAGVDLHTVCYLLPPACAAASTFLTRALSLEAGMSSEGALWAAAFIGAVPAYMRHTVAGAFYPNCIATPLMALIALALLRALRRPRGMLWAASAAAATAAPALATPSGPESSSSAAPSTMTSMSSPVARSSVKTESL